MQVGVQTIRAALATALISLIGCESRDERLADYAQQAMAEQARQNNSMAQQSQQVVQHSGELTKAAERLVEQDASARRELIEAQATLQSQLHDERATLDQRREQLHSEQKSLTSAMAREPVLAQAVLTGGLVVAALLPLLVTVYALSRLPASSASDDQLLTDALLDELVGQPAIGQAADGRPAIENADRPRLGGTDEAASAVARSGTG